MKQQAIKLLLASLVRWTLYWLVYHQNMFDIFRMNVALESVLLPHESYKSGFQLKSLHPSGRPFCISPCRMIKQVH